MGVKLCGWRLAETLQMICKDYGGFYSSNYRRMRDTSPDFSVQEEEGSIVLQGYPKEALWMNVVASTAFSRHNGLLCQPRTSEKKYI
ncbi:hypothetical protein CEXT_403191 [Caerostris extrusa]|uniref:Insulin-like domain-containing protein n=1 Tax=Caerostris extrusa TaxID=172846 RepID=A0AAV4XJH0_CAEEX|nr:hypothetical protein CEXT_403191 [Caerostris extrusa]